MKKKTNAVMSENDCPVIEKRYAVLRCTVAEDGITVTTEPCPFCGEQHRHGTGGKDYKSRIRIVEGIPTLGHRIAHCLKRPVEINLNGVRVSNDNGYYLGVVLNGLDFSLKLRNSKTFKRRSRD